MRKSIFAPVLVVVALIAGLGIWSGISGDSGGSSEKVTELTVYSGRSEEFIAPFFAEWESTSGIKLNVRYGDSAELAAQILEEGKNSPADLFLSQDAGSLGAVSAAGLVTQLPKSVGRQIQKQYVAEDRSWVGVTGRARVFAYRPGAVAELPQSVADLTKPIYRGKVGIAPSNASFQAFVTAMINEKGEKFAKNWLSAMKANGAKVFLKNSAIVEAIDKGEISLGLVNHYYIWEVSEALGRSINVENGYFAPGDIGNLVNVSGAAVLKTSEKQETAEDLINFLTDKPAQLSFVEDTHEYSLISGIKSPDGVPAIEELGSPRVDLSSLENVQKTQDLLVAVGLL